MNSEYHFAQSVNDYKLIFAPEKKWTLTSKKGGPGFQDGTTPTYDLWSRGLSSVNKNFQILNLAFGSIL